MPLTFIPSLIECVRAPVVPTTPEEITAKVDLDISQNVKGKNGDNSCWGEEPFKVLLTVVKSPIVWLTCPHFYHCHRFPSVAIVYGTSFDMLVHYGNKTKSSND